MTAKRILVIEDDPFYIEIFEKKLIAAGYQVDIARDGNEGLIQARAQVPDLILLDQVMPVKDGIQTLKELREDEKLKSIPVIMLSNMSDIDEELLSTYNINGYIEKASMSVDQALAVISRHISAQ